MAHDPAGTTYKINRGEVDSEYLRTKLKLKSLDLKKTFSEKYPHAQKFFDDRGVDLAKIRQHSAKVIGAGALTGTLLLTPPVGLDFKSPVEMVKHLDEPSQKTLLNLIKSFLPSRMGPLTRSQEKAIEQVLQEIVGVKARAALEGEHLNTTYGYIGAEQHLMRYPGDTMSSHPKVLEDDEGMAPGKGAWGYFAYSKGDLTPHLIDTEMWYAVVQTLYLPDWSARQPYLRDWYKYRKVLIVNTINGNAVVAAIADAGPAAWTGKHFGGSPEVMNYLGGPRYKKGPVIMFFVDDPENNVQLGPVEYNKLDISELALKQI